MQITLCEDDGIFFQGVPRNVVIVVKFNDGKTIRIPYPADKFISSLYEDLKNIAPIVIGDDQIHTEMQAAMVEAIPMIQNKVNVVLKPLMENHKKDTSNVIEKEDIVTLIKLDEGRDPNATCDLQLGHDYRVLSVKSTQIGDESGGTRVIVHSYEVVDDNSKRPERTMVLPHEIVLKSKRQSPIIKKELSVSEILPCSHCQQLNDLVLDGTAFKGTCVACNNDIVIERVIRKCLTPKCANDVSCFDVGGKYSGKCNKCMVIAEVPYA